MSESDFPSGPWVGFYTYSGAHDKHRMDLGLDFANGRVSGEGNDDVGAFVISGRFDSAKGECDWTKTYIGAHDVFYRGFREGDLGNLGDFMGCPRRFPYLATQFRSGQRGSCIR